MTNSKIYESGKNTRFSSTNQPTQNGRRISQVSLIRAEFDLNLDWTISKSDARKFLEFLAFAPVAELRKLTKDDTLPAVVLSYIKALLTDIKFGRVNAAKDILELSFGKALKKFEDEERKPAPSSLSEFSKEDILIGIKHGLAALDLDGLKSAEDMLRNELQKKLLNFAS